MQNKTRESVENTIEKVLDNLTECIWNENIKFSPLFCDKCDAPNPELKISVLVPSTSMVANWAVCRYCAKEILLK